jgi:hypothetical protein
MKIAFFIRHYNERGMEVSTYDYADYNEKILGNESIIIGFTKEIYMKWVPYHFKEEVFEKFNKRFKVYQEISFEHIEHILHENKIDLFYHQTGGFDGETYPYGHVYNTKSLIHCVFNTSTKWGDIYIPISNYLNKKYNTNYEVLPYIVRANNSSDNLRKFLNIPHNSKVFGRHGGKDTFNIPFVKEIIKKIAVANPNIYFIFLNTNEFSNNIDNIIYLPLTVDDNYKYTFINTCDAMIHARGDGETFGHAIGEFAVSKKPIISFLGGKHVQADHCIVNADYAHFDILKDKIIAYRSPEELENIILNYDLTKIDMNNNGYMDFTPENVMSIFNKLINL